MFTLYPEAFERVPGIRCRYRTLHARLCGTSFSWSPISNHCISVDVHGSQSKDLQQQILAALLAHRSVWDVLNL